MQRRGLKTHALLGTNSHRGVKNRRYLLMIGLETEKMSNRFTVGLRLGGKFRAKKNEGGNAKEEF
jgi:hypothetical protein